jgi:hypothetical protein
MTSDRMIEQVGGNSEEELDLTNAHLPTLADVQLSPTLKVKLANPFSYLFLC